MKNEGRATQIANQQGTEKSSCQGTEFLRYKERKNPVKEQEM